MLLPPCPVVLDDSGTSSAKIARLSGQPGEGHRQNAVLAPLPHVAHAGKDKHRGPQALSQMWGLLPSACDDNSSYNNNIDINMPCQYVYSHVR
jgi:hypothetical protein